MSSTFPNVWATAGPAEEPVTTTWVPVKAEHSEDLTYPNLVHDIPTTCDDLPPTTFDQPGRAPDLAAGILNAPFYSDATILQPTPEESHTGEESASASHTGYQVMTSVEPYAPTAPLEPGTQLYPGPPIAFVDPRGGSQPEVYNRVPLGEKGRMELKAAIRQALKNKPELREKVNAVAKLRCATIPQLLKIAAICDLWFMALNISRKFVETRTGKQNRRPKASASDPANLAKTRARSKIMKVNCSDHNKSDDQVASPRCGPPTTAQLILHQQSQSQTMTVTPAKISTGSLTPSTAASPCATASLDPTGWGSGGLFEWDGTALNDSCLNLADNNLFSNSHWPGF